MGTICLPMASTRDSATQTGSSTSSASPPPTSAASKITPLFALSRFTRRSSTRRRFLFLFTRNRTPLFGMTCRSAFIVRLTDAIMFVYTPSLIRVMATTRSLLVSRSRDLRSLKEKKAVSTASRVVCQAAIYLPQSIREITLATAGH